MPQQTQVIRCGLRLACVSPYARCRRTTPVADDGLPRESHALPAPTAYVAPMSGHTRRLSFAISVSEMLVCRGLQGVTLPRTRRCLGGVQNDVTERSQKPGQYQRARRY